MNTAQDERFMRLALEEAEKAAAEGEVPVGCVITLGDEVIAAGRNRRETGKNALLHAETSAVYGACEKLGGWRLWQCTLYVTLEPCPMCAGAILNARIPRVVFGARDRKNGACGSALNVLAMPENFRPEVCGGVLEAECGALLSGFFETLRRGGKSGAAPW